MDSAFHFTEGETEAGKIKDLQEAPQIYCKNPKDAGYVCVGVPWLVGMFLPEGKGEEGKG